MFKIFKQVLIFTKLGILSPLVTFILGREIGKRLSGMPAWFGLTVGILA